MSYLEDMKAQMEARGDNSAPFEALAKKIDQAKVREIYERLYNLKGNPSADTQKSEPIAAPDTAAVRAGETTIGANKRTAPQFSEERQYIIHWLQEWQVLFAGILICIGIVLGSLILAWGFRYEYTTTDPLLTWRTDRWGIYDKCISHSVADLETQLKAFKKFKCN